MAQTELKQNAAKARGSEYLILPKVELLKRCLAECCEDRADLLARRWWELAR